MKRFESGAGWWIGGEIVKVTLTEAVELMNDKELIGVADSIGIDISGAVGLMDDNQLGDFIVSRAVMVEGGLMVGRKVSFVNGWHIGRNSRTLIPAVTTVFFNGNKPIVKRKCYLCSFLPKGVKYKVAMFFARRELNKAIKEGAYR